MKHIRNINRQTMMLPAAVVIIVCILCMSGIFPYSRSGETAINQLTVADGSVTIQEPAWDAEGQSMAEHTEPGMLIPKNPSGINNGNTDLYIRLKMTVELKDFDETGKSQTYIDNYKDNNNPDTASTNTARAQRRLDSILKAIKCKDSNNSVYDFLTWDTTENKWICNNNKFYFDSTNYGTVSKAVYYFYFTGTQNNAMEKVEPLGETDELFSYVDIPVYKKDYLGVFDQKFDIILEAQGIPVGGNESLSVEDAKTKF